MTTNAAWAFAGFTLVAGIVISTYCPLFSRREPPEPPTCQNPCRPPPPAQKFAGPHPFVLAFPRSRRDSMASLPSLKRKFVARRDITGEVLRARALPTDRAPDMEEDDWFTPTGFSTQDIRMLGRFPDYAVLSGVPDPKPVGDDFDIRKARFRPFRPFRWPYHQHMAIMKFDADYWVELEQNYFATMSARRALLQKHGERIFFHGPGTDLPCRELMEMVVRFVTIRYPGLFSLHNDNTVLVNHLLKTSSDLVSTHPLRVLFDNIPEDFALMLRNDTDGLYHLRAAIVCSSVGWDVAQHRDSPMREIHTHVPDASRMQFSIERTLSRMAADTPIQRGSWGLEDWDAMWTSPVVTPGWQRSAFSARPEALKPDDVRLRCDWQTLRRLPVSGAIAFNFKAILTPLAELAEERFVPALLKKVLEEGKENLIEYKCEDHVRKVAVGVLGDWAEGQISKGWVPRDWEPETLQESPFYPGWEKRWRERQGF